MSDYGRFRLDLATRILREKLSPTQAAEVLRENLSRFFMYRKAMEKEIKEWTGTAHWRDVSCPKT
jgi:hypothetical protein